MIVSVNKSITAYHTTKKMSRTPGKELSVSLRSEIIEARKAGLSTRKIAQKFEVPQSTVMNTIRLEPLRDNNNSRPRPTREKIDEKETRCLLREIKRSANNKRMPLKELSANSASKPSSRTVQRKLKKERALRSELS